jgi:hypothetical protein
VTYQGKPVVFGTVVVVGPDGLPKSGPIQPDGTYRVAGVRAGAAKVTVTSPAPPGATPPGGPKPRVGRDADERKPDDAGEAVNPEVAKNWFPLPDKFGDLEKSGLSYTLQPGSNPIDIDLK